MAQRVLGTLTIGQTPPPVIAPIIDRYVPERVRRIHRGLLDGLSQPDIEALYGIEQGGPILVTRLFDGSSVQLSGPEVERGVQVKLDALEQEGCEVILLLCTGRFRGLQCRQCWLLQPDEIIPPMAAGLLQHRLLSIIVPLAAQIHSERGKWRKLGRPPILGSASPYADDRGILAHAGAALAKPGAECLLLDCIGFTERHRSRLAAIGLPVILSNALMAKAVGELFSGWGGN